MEPIGYAKCVVGGKQVWIPFYAPSSNDKADD